MILKICCILCYIFAIGVIFAKIDDGIQSTSAAFLLGVLTPSFLSKILKNSNHTVS